MVGRRNICARSWIPPLMSADEVWIVTFEIGRLHHTARENAVAKPGREAFDLAFDRVAHVNQTIIRHVTIRPKRVLTRRRASGIKQRRLRKEDEGFFRVPAVCCVPL